MLIEKITEGKYGFRSDFLSDPNRVEFDNSPWNTIVTSGDALRRTGTSSKHKLLRPDRRPAGPLRHVHRRGQGWPGSNDAAEWPGIACPDVDFAALV
jgi:hypothetical protein